MHVSLAKMNASSWRKAVDLIAQGTQANRQVQTAATADSSQLESFPLSALSSSPTPEVTEPENDCLTPATTSQQLTSQDTDWPDAIPIQIPSSIDQPEDQGHVRHQAQHNSESFEIPDLEENSEEEQFADLDSYLAHHNTYEASQYIHQEYRSQ